MKRTQTLPTLLVTALVFLSIGVAVAEPPKKPTVQVDAIKVKPDLTVESIHGSNYPDDPDTALVDESLLFMPSPSNKIRVKIKNRSKGSAKGPFEVQVYLANSASSGPFSGSTRKQTVNGIGANQTKTLTFDSVKLSCALKNKSSVVIGAHADSGNVLKEKRETNNKKFKKTKENTDWKPCN